VARDLIISDGHWIKNNASMRKINRSITLKLILRFQYVALKIMPIIRYDDTMAHTAHLIKFGSVNLQGDLYGASSDKCLGLILKNMCKVMKFSSEIKTI
jgi:hypothetical protein